MMEFTCKGSKGASIRKRFPTWTELRDWIKSFYETPGKVSTIYLGCVLPLAEVEKMAAGEHGLKFGTMDARELAREFPAKVAQLVEKFGRCCVCSVFPKCATSGAGCSACPKFVLDYLHGGKFVPDSPQDAQCKCLRCGHEWTKKVKWEPKACPACKAVLWNKPYRNNMKRKK